MAVVRLVFPHVAGVLAGDALENEKYRDIRLQLMCDRLPRKRTFKLKYPGANGPPPPPPPEPPCVLPKRPKNYPPVPLFADLGSSSSLDSSEAGSGGGDWPRPGHPQRPKTQDRPRLCLI
eukprot:9941824-Alexandrium_andersonii.AAC.1